ncbi:MAG: AAA family ATPase [Planctomycetota bacterium]
MRGVQERSSIAGAGTQDCLSGQCIIFTQGPTATFKTRLTAYLGECLGVQVVATHQAGKITNKGVLDHAKRADRYKRLLNRARAIVGNGKSVILDGVFDELRWRQVVYGLAGDSGAQVIVIATRCDSPNLIEARLRQRAENSDLPDSEMADLWFWNLTSEAIAASPVAGDDDFISLRGELITFETGTNRNVTCSPGASTNAELVAQLIEASPLMACRP